MNKTKKTIGKIVLASLSIFAASTTTVNLTSCKKKDTPVFENQGEVGNYYTLDGNTVYFDNNVVTLKIGSDQYNGEYKFDKNVFTIRFDGDVDSIIADYKENYIEFTYSGVKYKFYKDIDYTVSFNTDGGSVVSNATIKNGFKVTAPNSNPTKNGYVFLGWYKDADYKQKYDFNSEVTSNTTIYALFKENTNPREEFTVNFESNVEELKFESVMTYEKKVVNLPNVSVEGKKFLGWWVSDYNDSNRLTYKYDESMELKQNTTLFAIYEDQAPKVSVNSSKISWNSLGLMKDYSINIKNLDGDSNDPIFSKKISTVEQSFDFASLPAGDYLVEVTCGNYTGKAYFANKKLPVVNLYVDDFKLSWNKAFDATNYTIEVDCGNEYYNVKPTSLGDVYEYDFEKIPMSANGIKFTLYAEAEGYIQSKATYVLTRVLDAPQLTYDKSTETIKWSKIDNASKYKVTVVTEDDTFNYYVTDTSFSLAEFTGSINYTVSGYSDGYYANSSTGTETKTTLSTPGNISLVEDGYKISWSNVKNAKGYYVVINDGEPKFVTDNFYELTEEEKQISNLKVKIQAVAEDASNNSYYSNIVEFNNSLINYLVFSEGELSWNPILGVTKYVVIVDDTDKYFVNTNSCKLKLSTGHHTYKVAACSSDESYDESKLFKYENDVFNMYFETNIDDKELDNVSYEYGNVIDLPSIEYPGYTFTGWFKEKGNITTNEFNSSIYDFKEDVTIYAGWTPKSYSISLEYGIYGEGDKTNAQVLFGTKFELPVPKNSDNYKVFMGWYSELNGQGIKYSDENGLSLNSWNDYKDITLYACYADVFEYELIDNGEAYSIKKGFALTDSNLSKNIKEITIPVKYNDKYITTIETAAFADCTNLVVINIPDTIKNIEVGKEGPTASQNCFKSCRSLQSVNIYTTGEVKEEDIKYFSIDGVLIYNNDYNGVELAYFPYYTRTGIYTIPDKVTTIPQMAFKDCDSLTEIVVPYSVTQIDTQAFSGCAKLEKVTFTFLSEEDANEENELNIASKAFYSNSKLVRLDLPARLSNFDSDIIQSCNYLEEINIFGNHPNKKYKSENGVVLTLNGSELLYCPVGKTGEYEVGNSVKAIKYHAFMGCNKLTKVTIGSNVTIIDKEAFKSCSKLEELVFKGTSTDQNLIISTGAFYGCSSLTELTLPENLKTLEVNAFGGTSKLETVHLNSVREIVFDNNAFGTTATSPVFYVKHLTLSKTVQEFEITGVFGTKLEDVTVEEGNEYYKSVDGVLYNSAVTKVVYYPTDREGDYDLPSTIVEIGARVFQSKPGITSITFPSSLKSIGEGAFKSCSKLTSITFVDGGEEELVIGNEAFASCSNLTNVVLPNRLVSIGDSAFTSCKSIVSLTIPDSVQTIGEFAFRYNSKLETINLPKNLIALGESKLSYESLTRTHAFQGCSELKNIYISEENTNYVTVDGILYKKIYGNSDNSANEYLGLSLIVLPAGISGEVVFPKDLIQIGDQIMNDSQVTSIKFAGNGEKEIVFGNYTFYSCKQLQSIELPQGLKTIPQNCFYQCESLTSIVIPKTVTLIMDRAFNYCKNIESIEFEEGGTEDLEFADGYKSSGSGYSQYQGFLYNNHKVKSLVLPQRTKKIGNYAFAAYYSSSYSSDYSSALESIVIPSNVNYIGKNAFYYSKNLINVEFSGEFSELTLDDYCFANTSIVNISIPNNTIKLGNYVFSSCANMESIVIPATVKSLGNGVFNNLKKLTSVTFEENSVLETIGYNAFASTAISSITIPKTVVEIGYQAFSGCANLKNVEFENGKTEEGCSLKTIGYKAFANTGLEKFEFPYCGKDEKGGINKLTIGNATNVNLFEGSKNLSEVYLSEAIVSIDKLFIKCPGLTKITISENSENFKTDETAPIIYNINSTAIQYIYGRVENISIPDGIEEIGSYAFAGQTDIKTLKFPKTLKTIGEYAFQNCLGVEEVVFAEGSVITEIGNYAFYNCNKLKSITLPNSITDINEGTFIGCTSLNTVKFPKNLKTIGKSAFAQTRALQEVTFPDSLVEIGQYGFSGSGLTSVNFNEGLKTLGQESFEDCLSLTSVVIPNTITTFKNYIFRRCYALTSVSLPDNLTTLGQGMFSNCTALQTITLPSGLTSLPNDFMEKCTSLKTIKIPNVTSIGDYAFDGCTSLLNVDFADVDKLTSLGTYVFRNCSSLNNVVLPSSVTTIGNYAFQASGLTEIVIPASVKKLGTTAKTGSVFADCNSLVSVTLPESLTTIYGSVFENCTALTEITIPSSVTILGDKVFKGCSSLTKAEITGAIKTCGQYLFAECSSLTDVTINSKSTKTGSYMFQKCTSLTNVVLPTSLASSGLSTYLFDGCTSLESIEIPSSVTQIPSNFARNCSMLKNVVVKGKITSIGSYAFNGCSLLESIDLTAAITASSLKTLSTYAFQKCSSLKSINIPNVTTVSNYAFDGCTSLTDVTLKAATTIGTYTFRDCTSLKTISLPETVTKLDIGCFMNSGLTSITIPAKVSTINGAAFNGCKNLSVTNNAELFVAKNNAIATSTGELITIFNLNSDEYEISSDIVSFDTYVFTGVKGLRKIIIPSSVTAISSYAFQNCLDLEEVVLPETLTKIGSYAFNECLKLNKINFPSSLEEINAFAFENTALTEVVLPDGLTTLGNGVFKDCKNLERVYLPGTITSLATSSASGGLFNGCISLTSVEFGEGYSMLASYMFANCSSLETIVLPQSASEKFDTSTYMFMNCTKLNSVVLPSDCTIIPTYAFSGCSALANIIVPDSVVTIDSSAFANSGLTSIKFNSVTKLGSSVFAECQNLVSVELPGTITSISSNVFKNCTKLKNVILHEGMTVTGSSMFLGCSSLESIEIPSTVLSINSYMFQDCENLTEVILHEGLNEISYMSFYNDSKLSKINLPSTLTKIYYGSFYNCTSIKKLLIPEGCSLTQVSSAEKSLFGNWTSDQIVCTKDSIYDITGSWGEACSYSSYYGYWSNTNATFIFDYSEEN